jgi:hypothetical protein
MQPLKYYRARDQNWARFPQTVPGHSVLGRQGELTPAFTGLMGDSLRRVAE